MPTFTLCPSCGVDNPVTRRFCRGCGAPITPVEAATAPGGFVADGRWVRPPGEFIRLVPRELLKQNLFRAGLEVPRGTVGVIVCNDQVEEVLRPGFRATESVIDRFTNLFTGKLDNTSIYLIDVQPIVIGFEVARQQQGKSTSYEVAVDARIYHEDRRQLAQVLRVLLGPRESVTTRDVYNLLRPRVLALVTPRLSGQMLDPAQLAKVQAEVQAELQRAVGNEYGLALGVSIGATTSATSVEVRVGQGATPATKKCVGCAVDIESTRKFCGKCGKEQPVMTSPSRSCGGCGAHVAEGRKFCGKCGAAFVPPPAEQAPIYTADSQQVEVDIVVRAEGSLDPSVGQQLTPLVASAVAQHVRGRTYDQVACAGGFVELERAIRETLNAGGSALGVVITDVTLLDMRSKGKEWVLGARAEIERAMEANRVGREWITADTAAIELQGEQVDLKRLAYEVELRRLKVDRDQAFALATAEVDDNERHNLLERRAQRIALDDAYARDVADQSDRSRRQELLDTDARLDVSDANRATDRDLGLDAAGRRRDRAVAGEDHTDALSSAARDQELEVRRTGYERENETSRLRYERTRDREEADGQRAEQAAQARHEMGLESEVATHDAELARKAAGLAAERQRGEADTASYVSRSETDTAVYDRRARSQAQLDEERARSDMSFTDEERREKLKLEKLEKLMALDEMTRRAEREEAARAAQQAADNTLRAEQAARAAQQQLEGQQQDHALKMRAQLEGKTYEQMLAMQAAELAALDGGAEVAAQVAAMKRAEAEASGGAALTAAQKEMYERMLQMQALTSQQMAQQTAAQGASQQAAALQQQQMMMQMMSMMQQLSAQQMQTMGTVATAAVGGQRELDAARTTALQQGSQTAVHIAQQAMGNMAQVATAGAGAPAVHAMPMPVAAPGWPTPVSTPAAPAPAPAPAQAAPASKGASPTCSKCGEGFPLEDICCGACGARRT